MLRPWVPLAGIVLGLTAVVVASVLASGWVTATFWGGGGLLFVSLIGWLARAAPAAAPRHARSPLDDS